MARYWIQQVIRHNMTVRVKDNMQDCSVLLTSELVEFLFTIFWKVIEISWTSSDVGSLMFWVIFFSMLAIITTSLSSVDACKYQCKEKQRVVKILSVFADHLTTFENDS